VIKIIVLSFEESNRKDESAVRIGAKPDHASSACFLPEPTLHGVVLKIFEVALSRLVPAFDFLIRLSNPIFELTFLLIIDSNGGGPSVQLKEREGKEKLGGRWRVLGSPAVARTWRKREGVEPTKDRLAAPPGFEVRTPHRGRFSS
jgi:hypothetical protein